ncbi:hypothetical protein HPG69_009702 [Diceros bicornis minor]|uniref:Uncharacterized protein n=1 Tax=Diceros bicornis minor TaxID=77932 RepID=A0A7J7EXT0_DICBM|nr:hypothetical protein HPG69_009702 [Diceros bicornis minor]
MKRKARKKEKKEEKNTRREREREGHQRKVLSSLYSSGMDPVKVENALGLDQQFACPHLNS